MNNTTIIAYTNNTNTPLLIIDEQSDITYTNKTENTQQDHT